MIKINISFFYTTIVYVVTAVVVIKFDNIYSRHFS